MTEARAWVWTACGWDCSLWFCQPWIKASSVEQSLLICLLAKRRGAGLFLQGIRAYVWKWLRIVGPFFAGGVMRSGKFFYS